MRESIDKFFESYYSKFRPSRVHGEYRKTFAYRLSELVFGSLIASYILGFLSFASSLVREHQIANITSYFDPFFSINFHDYPVIAKFYMLIVYVNISFIYALFTALIYFNFHQSILYIQRSDKKAATDYLMSLGVAVMFGLSMLAPRYAVGLFLVLAIIVLRKKRTVSEAFFKSLSAYTDEILNPRSSTQSNRDWKDDEQDTRRSSISKEIQASMHEVGKTPASWLTGSIRYWIWGCCAFAGVWTALVFMGLHDWISSPISFILIAAICALHLFLLACIAGVLLKFLKSATDTLSAGDNANYQEAVDEQFVLALKHCKSLLKNGEIAAKLAQIMVSSSTPPESSTTPLSSLDKKASDEGNNVG